MRGWYGAALLVGAVTSSACGGEDPSARLELAVSPTPAAVGPAQVRVSFRDTARVTEALRVVVTGRPPGEGAGLVVDTARAVRPGLWVVDSLLLDVTGEWLLEARAEAADGRVLRGSHRIRVVGM